MTPAIARRVGILGGGQLGWMLALEGQRLGMHTTVVDMSANCAAARAADAFIRGSIDDADVAVELARQVDVVTVETEHVDYRVLERIEPLAMVRPAAAVLQTVQDRLAERRFLARGGFPQTGFRAVDSREDCMRLGAELHGTTIIKGRFGGYDGKGQARAERPAGIAAAWREIGEQPAVLEDLVPFDHEISVIVARAPDGGVQVFPVAENIHRNHILHLTIAPARIPEPVQRRAIEIGVGVAEALDHVGVIATEMFVLRDGEVLVNEIAPRVHNSGHFTLGACVTSQFEQHVRTVCGLPPGDPRLLSPVVMLNLLGDLWRDSEPDWPALLAQPSAQLYLYGKTPPKAGRKMGHVLFLDDDVEAALGAAESADRRLRAVDAHTPALARSHRAQ